MVTTNRPADDLDLVEEVRQLTEVSQIPLSTIAAILKETDAQVIAEIVYDWMQKSVRTKAIPYSSWQGSFMGYLRTVRPERYPTQPCVCPFCTSSDIHQLAAGFSTEQILVDYDTGYFVAGEHDGEGYPIEGPADTYTCDSCGNLWHVLNHS